MKTGIEMAHEAGFQVNQGALLRIYLEHFAELVRADAIAEEREACAKVCDALDAMNWSEYGEYSSGYGDEIRKRGTQ